MNTKPKTNDDKSVYFGKSGSSLLKIKVEEILSGTPQMLFLVLFFDFGVISRKRLFFNKMRILE